MARSRVRLTGKFTLNKKELECVESAHHVIAELITNIAHMSHVGYKPSDPLLRAHFDKQNSSTNIPESLRVVLFDRFGDLSFNPEKANILSLVTLIRLPGKPYKLFSYMILFRTSVSVLVSTKMNVV
ncbi:unnamed protein product [Schistosoma margrebowiei]|uniref:Uncharacterized protein n=1 Tax=Schistosoma margrebowiei TaxID=48269 RepID=A0A183MCG3_9TREM|nr:unnamed protein product [Schistosoma margrebowiei]